MNDFLYQDRCRMRKLRCRWMINAICLLLLITFGSVATVIAETMTLDEAISYAINQTSRGQIIRGGTEVAEQLYFARKMNFYLPEISINSSLPAYEIRETYDYLPASEIKELAKRTNLDFSSNISLSQSLITGGNFTARAFLRSNEWQYPQTGVWIEESRKLGSFDFSFDQPILKPSDPKFELDNRRDDLSIAMLAATEEQTAMTKEVIDAYLGTLQQSLKLSIAQNRFHSANLQARTDSIKLKEGVLADEVWLETASDRLDAELTVYDKESELAKERRKLNSLLDRESDIELETVVPVVPELLSSEEQESMLNRASSTVKVLTAHYQYLKQQREADFAASSHGLTGSISANYSKESGRVEVTARDRENLDLNTWGVKLEFSYPIWDGGSSSAEVKAAQLSADTRKLDYMYLLKSARAEMTNLLSSLTIAYRKLSVLQQQIELSKRKLTIAKARFDDGQISEIEYLDAKVAHLESQDKRLEALKNYLNDRAELEGKFSNQ